MSFALQNNIQTKKTDKYKQQKTIKKTNKNI